MTTVFVLQHTVTRSFDREDVKLIGVYSTRESAHAAVGRLRSQPGFRDHPKILDASRDDETDGFTVDEYRLDVVHWCEGFGIE